MSFLDFFGTKDKARKMSIEDFRIKNEMRNEKVYNPDKRYHLIASFDCPHCAGAMDLLIRQPILNLKIDVVVSMEELHDLIPTLTASQAEVPAIYDSKNNIWQKLPSNKYSLEGYLIEVAQWKD